jgi:hypothetical protein
MGVVQSIYSWAKQLFTGTPDEHNPTNDQIMKHHGMPENGDTPTCGAAPFSSPPMPVNVDDTTISHSSITPTVSSSQPSLFQNFLARLFSEKGSIQPEVWPTEEEFQSAKDRIEYDPEKLHFAVCGGSGAGKSSLINAFRGLKNDSKNPKAARTGVDETTMAITRYPDPREESPYMRLVWYDCPGAGTLECPGWQYLNVQGLFIFDIIVLVYATVIIPINLSNAD